LLFNEAVAQDKPLQTLRGSTTDKSIKTALSGATIELIGTFNKKTISNLGKILFAVFLKLAFGRQVKV
jgi:hypothetical protein